MARTKKVKNPNRVKAGKKAWAKKSAAEKARATNRLTGGKTTKKSGGKGGKKGGQRMAAKKTRKRSKQGFVSWAQNMITLGIASSNVIARIAESAARSDDKMQYFMRTMIQDHTGLGIDENLQYVDFDAKRMVRGYAPMAGAYAFKKVSSQVLKTVKIQSLIPGR